MTPPEHIAAAHVSGWGQPHPVSRTPLMVLLRDGDEFEVVWRELHSSYNMQLG